MSVNEKSAGDTQFCNFQTPGCVYIFCNFTAKTICNAPARGKNLSIEPGVIMAKF